jgi:hypothetical protein
METMRSGFFSGIVGVAALTVAVWPVAAGASRSKSFKFTENSVGAQISATEAVYKVHDSHLGDGAGVQVVKVSGLGGTDSETTYYGNGTAESHGSFKITAPDSHGISALTGHGQDTSGTGELKGFKSTYTYTGTFNTKTLVFKVVLKGTGSTAGP